MSDPTAVAVRARISEDTPRDLRGVDLLAGLIESRLGAVQSLQGRQGPFGRTDWPADLEASRAVLGRAAAALEQTLVAGRPGLTLASDCSLALATLPSLAAARPDVQVLWLDAHCDYDAPETTTIGFLGCMSLAGATGAWDAGIGPAPLPPQRVVLCGVRGSLDDFDGAGRAAVERSPVRMVPPGVGAESAVLAELGPGPVYVHLDPDVLDPAENPVPYARPGGLSMSQLLGLLQAVRARGPVVGVELTAFHSDDDPDRRQALGERLLDCLTALVA
jgi:arginase